MPMRPVKQNFATLRDQLTGPGCASNRTHAALRECTLNACGRVPGYLVRVLLREFVDLGGRNLDGKGGSWSAADLGIGAET